MAVFFYFLHVSDTSAQAGCNDPVVVESYYINTSLCISPTGSIAVLMPPNTAQLFSYQWSHNVTVTTNTADNLFAGVYNIKITRLSNPECFFDTSIIVPAVGFNFPYEITPATCMAADGKIKMLNLTNTYNWGILGVGSEKENLIGGNYLVTVTNPSLSCPTIASITVPVINPLGVSVSIIRGAKCDRNNGIAAVTVTGGSGNYSYSLGDSATLTKLGAGTNLLRVADTTGCEKEITFIMPALNISGTIQKTVHNVTCVGRSDGKLTVNVVPGANFAMPFDFAIRDVSGFEKDPNALPFGKYYLYVVDADSCALPLDSFNIGNPTPIQVQATVQPVGCDEYGEIMLTLTGGSGSLGVDWDDLNGNSQPINRLGLEAGVYSGIVFDSFFCNQALPDITVLSNCNRKQYVHEVVQANTLNVFCFDALIGIPDTAITTLLATNSADGQSSYGSWTFNNNNACLTYTAGPQTGFAIDTVCIIRIAPTYNLADTTCYVFSIVQQPPSNQYINFTLQPNTTALACGNFPMGFNHVVISQVNEPSLTGVSGSYGSYVINAQTGCLDFTSNQYVGNNVDDIMVLVYDTILNLSRVFHYVPSILSDAGCIGKITLADNYIGEVQDCDKLGSICLPIPYSSFTSYSVFDNGLPYLESSAGCSAETFINYVPILPQGEIFTIVSWMINGQSYSGGTFDDLQGLASLLDAIDNDASWEVLFGSFVVGGDILTNTYGDLVIKSAQNVQFVIDPTQLQVNQGTILNFSEGNHTVIFRDNINGCIDTTNVFIKCLECPPVQSNTPAADGIIRWETCNCTADTTFCTDVSIADWVNFSVTKNGLPFNNVFSCGVNVGFRVGVGTHHFIVTDNINGCNDTFTLELKCKSIDVAYTESIDIRVGQRDTILLDAAIIMGDISSVTRVCPNTGNADWQLIPGWSVVLTGIEVGSDTFCFQLCSDACDCAIAKLIVNVLPVEPTDVINAVDDRAFGTLNVGIDIPIFSNDTINGIAGNLAGISQLLFLSNTNFGTLEYREFNGIASYTPDKDQCGIDSFSYSIKNAKGITDTAMVMIQIACKKVLVFNGLSPNGDKLNDVWHIVGIDQYPKNEIKVFNRWGNMVLSESGYKNSKPWDGTWNGKDLPDGTYFYMIDLADGEDQLSGYLELRR